MQVSDSQILDGVRAGDRKSFAKLLSICEDDSVRANHLISNLEKRTAHVVGITGSPGVGKSSIINAILDKSIDKKIGVIAIDPSSPFTGGSLLGDRIRMQSHATSKNFFIRSFASRGALGGLSPSIFETCDAFETFKVDAVFIETVGVGQSDVEIVNVADTVVVLISPDGGDEVQMMKAGLMEIADFFVINKADNPISKGLLSKLRNILEMWKKDVPIFLTNSITGEGIENLIKALDKRFSSILESGMLAQKRQKRVTSHAQSILRKKIDDILQNVKTDQLDLEEIQKEVMKEICGNL
ncbi:MAG: methylmalonyl Co-A mutase-associated GTPase MeaB [Thermotogae bacterium]|jgi:LAO/AO transport system kinase|nr:methylmalonyl Co-A mutase-associated GTPase MeaB [Thermotogota bacterium]MCL5032891.1 methylmalonyl Co-A mutase-associated GTPase MeaB [Thermotogota bacterium]